MKHSALILVATVCTFLWSSLLVMLTVMPTTVEPFVLGTTTTLRPFFLQQEQQQQLTTTTTTTTTTTVLFAQKKKKTTTTSKTTFGGASMGPCPCGSKETYSKCCGKLHRDVNAYKSASAEQVVRARYSAYAKKQPDFLMASTHPLHKDFNTDLKKWKESIKQNMYDNFDMTECTIVKEEYPTEDTAQVQFIANLVLRETGELTAFMETSQFERAKTHGGWLYKNGTIAAAPGAADADGATDTVNTGESDEATVEKLKKLL